MPGPPSDALLLDPARVEAVRCAVEATKTADASLSRLLRLATRLLGVDFGFLSLVDAERETFAASVTPPGRRLPDALDARASVCAHLVHHGVPLIVPDLAADPTLRSLEEVRELGLRAYAGMPVRSQDGHVLGGFCVGHSAPRGWSPGDSALLEDLAAAASTELQLRVARDALARTQGVLRRQAAEQAALHRVARLVALNAPPDVVQQHVAQEIVDGLGASGAVVLRFLPDGSARVAASAGAAADSEAVCANALARLRATGRSSEGHNGDEPCAAIPVLADGVLWGALVVLSERRSVRHVLAQLEALADTISLVIAHTAAREQLVVLSRTDPLTGAANRRALDERLEEEVQRSRRHGTPLTLAALDLDRFKQINDENGHIAGDRVLLEVTGRVQHHLRVEDLLVRLGGDEFVVLLPATDYAAGSAVVERLHDLISAVPINGLVVTASLGAAVVDGGAVISRSALLRLADEALYEAKAAGRNAIRIVRHTAAAP